MPRLPSFLFRYTALILLTLIFQNTDQFYQLLVLRSRT